MGKSSKSVKSKKSKVKKTKGSGILEEMTLDEVKRFKPEIVLLPLGSTEPHGDHLPYGTDTLEASTFCRLGTELANRKGARVLLYPTLPITNNVNFKAFPFALRIGIRTLMQVIIDVVTQCYEDGVKKVVIFNAHGGNPPALHATLREISGMENMPFVCLTSIDNVTAYEKAGIDHPVEFRSDHAGEYETSLIMHIRPDLVRTKKLQKYPFGKLKVEAFENAYFVRPWHLYVPKSAGGETRKASAEKGKLMVEVEAKALAQLLVEFSKAPVNAKFPYK